MISRDTAMSGGFAALGLMPELLRVIDDDLKCKPQLLPSNVHHLLSKLILCPPYLPGTLPTDIQDECIPLILGGGDVMAAAETGELIAHSR